MKCWSKKRTKVHSDPTLRKLMLVTTLRCLVLEDNTRFHLRSTWTNNSSPTSLPFRLVIFLLGTFPHMLLGESWESWILFLEVQAINETSSHEQKMCHPLWVVAAVTFDPYITQWCLTAGAHWEALNTCMDEKGPRWHFHFLSSQITIQRDSGLDVSAPKHGKIDPNNAPHVGGNQWAGGTGNQGEHSIQWWERWHASFFFCEVCKSHILGDPLPHALRSYKHTQKISKTTK